jgi:hypothetical protein
MAKDDSTRANPIKSGMTPWAIIQSYPAEVWEEFILEWSESLQPAYHSVVKLGGSGDKGRDIVAYTGDPQSDCDWDNYQCKHYERALTPVDAYVELGKLCHYTFIGDFTVPRKYRFVAPRGVGTKLHDLLKKPDQLRAVLYANWDKYCLKGISEAADTPLTPQLQAYIDKFDFKRVWFLSPQDVLKQHRTTKYWHQRFKIDPPARPAPGAPPDEIQNFELVYVDQLLKAYSQRTGKTFTKVSDLVAEQVIQDHFRRARGCYFSAEALGRFSRDQFTAGAFTGLKNDVYHGVIDVSICDHTDGMACLLETTKAAMALQLPDSDLKPYVGSADRIGVCHHLANDRALAWVKAKT